MVILGSSTLVMEARLSKTASSRFKYEHPLMFGCDVLLQVDSVMFQVSGGDGPKWQSLRRRIIMKVKVMLSATRGTTMKVKVVILSAMRRTARHFTSVASHSTKVSSEINPKNCGIELII